MGYILINPETKEPVRYQLSEQIAVYGTKEEALEDGFSESWIIKLVK